MNPDQTDPKEAILSRSFAIFDTLEYIQIKWTKQKYLTGGKRGKFVYLACPTNPLKGPELSTLNFGRTLVFGYGSIHSQYSYYIWLHVQNQRCALGA